MAVEAQALSVGRRLNRGCIVDPRSIAEISQQRGPSRGKKDQPTMRDECVIFFQSAGNQKGGKHIKRRFNTGTAQWITYAARPFHRLLLHLEGVVATFAPAFVTAGGGQRGRECYKTRLNEETASAERARWRRAGLIREKKGNLVVP